ncbi:MAG: hypothetical protein JW976_03450 [Syntrophaceae bacterium]|nr:hypothetical protein [Syntrophaceae bacterium]
MYVVYIAIATHIFAYLLDPFIVALVLYALKTIFNRNIPNIGIFIISLIFIAFLDNYYVPSFYLLKATMTIKNEEFLKFFNLRQSIPLYQREIITILGYFLQAIISLLTVKMMDKMHKREIKKAPKKEKPDVYPRKKNEDFY